MEITVSSAVTLEDAESTAIKDIEDYILNVGPYEFQDLVAALLRALGYYTPFVALNRPGFHGDSVC